MDVASFHTAIRSGDFDAVCDALAKQPELLNEKNASGQTAILVSKYYRQEQIAQHLLEQRPVLDVFTAAAVGEQPLVLSEVTRDPALLAAHSSDGWTPLHLSAFFGHRQLAEALLERGAEVDARSTNAMKNTPLHAATAGRQAALVELLLEEGAAANATQTGGWTALHAASQNGDRDIVEILIAHGADLKVRAENNQTALDLAMLKGNADIASLLNELNP